MKLKHTKNLIVIKGEIKGLNPNEMSQVYGGQSFCYCNVQGNEPWYWFVWLIGWTGWVGENGK